MKLSPVPHVDSCQDVQFVNVVKPVQKVGVNLSFVATVSCTYCVYRRAATKEWPKSRSSSEQNKACKRCFFCKSVSTCPTCSKCPSCCSTSSYGKSTSQVWANVGCSGFQPESCIHSEGGLYSPLPDQTTSVQIFSYPQWVCQSSPEEVIGYPCDQKCSRNGQGAILSGVLQPALSGSKTKQLLASDIGYEHLEHLPQVQKVQNGNTRDHKTLPTKRRMGHIAGLHMFPYIQNQGNT